MPVSVIGHTSSVAPDDARPIVVRSSLSPFEVALKRQKPLPPDSDGVKAAGAAVQRMRG